MIQHLAVISFSGPHLIIYWMPSQINKGESFWIPLYHIKLNI
jgi:hypothetical protein